MKMYRQGDVLIREVQGVPTKTKPVEREGGRIVLAHGEVTGHSHAIAARDGVRFMETDQGSGGAVSRYLEVTAKSVALRHEEHAEIKLPRGCYEVSIQREYHPEAVRNVED